ncbi:MAG TPA: hypothetical protein VLV76_07555 [Candidatus Acidoferrum sp.]|nr:hypothetical protein [Candidatus Acidoferrum sp.]
MVSEHDIWRSALVMTRRYKADALLEAAARADRLFEDGDWQAAIIWHRIIEAIGRLQTEWPPDGKTVH